MASPMPPGYPVTTPYGKPGSWAAGYHTGADYDTRDEVGIPVRATKGGVISTIGNAWGAAYGIHVVIAHPRPGIRSGYCHLSKVKVRVGQQVKAGQIIGWSGNTGNSTGPHLHYEERHEPYGYWDHRKPEFNRN